MSYLGPTLRRRGRRPSAGRRLLVAVALSVAFNLLLVSRIDLSWLSARPEVVRDVGLTHLSEREWEANRAVAAAAPEQPPKGQVVRIAPPKEPPAEPPRDAKYLAEYDSSVAKETKSRWANNEYRGNAPVPSRPTAPVPKGSVGRLGRQRSAERLPSPPGPGAGPPPSLSPGGVAIPGLPNGLASRKLDLQPSAALMRRLVGGPAAEDLPDVEEGEGTFLNTRTWKYAGYFNRIKDDLDQQWVSAGREQVEARDPTGQRFLYRDRLAVLDVTLDGSGTVKQVRVTRSTGVDFLDRIAVDLFQRAQIFSNPPPGIVDGKGEINFAFGINFEGVTPSLGLLRRPAFHD